MNISDLRTKYKDLLIVNNHLRSEFTTLDALMKEVGFSHGIATVKATAKQILDEMENPQNEF